MNKVLYIIIIKKNKNNNNNNNRQKTSFAKIYNNKINNIA